MMPLGALSSTMPAVLAASGEGLSDMWRIELLHPALVHFPIALTIVGTAFWLLGGAQRWWPRLEAFAVVGAVTVIIAAVSAWAGTQSGFWADEAVGRELYDPRLLKDHENLALTFAWLVSGCAALVLACRYLRMPMKVRRIAWWFASIALIVSCGIVIYASHLGAGLVYQQGAGVILP